MKNIAISILILTVILVFSSIAVIGLEKEEKVECLKLQAQSVEFKEAGFYLTAWQKEMCDAQNIIINAPVLVPTENYE